MLGTFIGTLSDWLYTYILVILLIAAGLYFTLRTRFVQLRLFAESIRVVGERPREAGAVSSFQALMVSTASRVGTGNIVGISTAICCGGAGAVFWMWVIALIGGASAFVESTLAQIYKRRAPDGSCYGGPRLLYRGGSSQPSSGGGICCGPGTDLCRWLQHAGFL